MIDAVKIKELLDRHSYDELKSELGEIDPADVADILECLEPEEADSVFKILDSNIASDVLVEMEPGEIDDVVDGIPKTRLAEMLKNMALDDAVDILGSLEKVEQDEIFSMLDPELCARLKKLLGYEEDSAGGLMTPELCTINADATVQEALNTLASTEFTDPVYVAFAVDASKKILGQITISELLTRPKNVKISDVIEKDVVCAKVEEDQESIANKFRKYDLFVMPVVDDEGRLVGRITADDVMDVMQEEADEDIAKIAGAPDMATNEISPLRVASLRLPWLMITLITGMIISLIIRKLIGLTSVEGLAAFIPVVMAMGGNTGMQSSAVTVRGIAMGENYISELLKISSREILVGIIMGVACGILAGIIVWINMHFFGGVLSMPPFKLALVVGISMCIAMTFASLCGTLLPLGLHKVGIDPALASGPFITTGNDLSSALIYMLMCYLLFK